MGMSCLHILIGISEEICSVIGICISTSGDSISECACRFVGYGCRNDGIYDDCGDEIDSRRQVCSIFHPVSKNAVWSMQWMQLTVDGIDSSSSKVSNLHVILPSMQDRWMQWSERN